MNFINALSELDKLYESVELGKEEELVEVEEDCQKEALKEAADEEIIEDEEIVAEEAEEAKQVVLECANCGALVIKPEAEAADFEDECAFCGETAGYEMIGTFEPYEIEVVDDEAEEEAPEEPEGEEEVVEESIEEGIFNKSAVNKNIMAYKPNAPEYSKEVADDIKSICGGEVIAVKLKGKENAPIDYVWVANNNSEYRKAMKYTNKKYPDTSFTYDYDYSNCIVTEGILDTIKDKIFN